MAPEEALARLLDGQRSAARRGRAARCPRSPRPPAAPPRALAAGHRVAYAGAGSAGLMALADALEIAGTFGIPAERTPVLFAGGAAALLAMTGAVEDDRAAAARDLAAAGLGAGRRRRLRLGQRLDPLHPRRRRGRPRRRRHRHRHRQHRRRARSLALADVAVLLDTGPEVVAGSTRMGAGTAQKVALNLLSTLAGLRLGHVHDGYMVNLVADNAKLRDRAAGIVAAISGTPTRPPARAALAATGGAVKPAVLLAAGARDPDRAAALLAASGGHLGPALDALRSDDPGATGPHQQGVDQDEAHPADRRPARQHAARRHRLRAGRDPDHRELAQRRPRHLAGEDHPRLRGVAPRHQAQLHPLGPDRVQRRAELQARRRLRRRPHHLPARSTPASSSSTRASSPT